MDSAENHLPLAQRPSIAHCVVSAAHRYWVPVEALLAILLQEAGKPGMANENTNGSRDFGIMQINSLWLKPASPLYGYVTEDLLRNDSCTNIHSAAWILRVEFDKVGDIWKAIGRYHSPGTPELAQAYIQRVNNRVPLARHLVRSNLYYTENIAAYFMNGKTLAGSASTSLNRVEPQ